ncbi:GIY-YIG nuclease family protein [Parvularcula maris]|uniref:GIY-YIG nuclease family protein n=1 Tax=Parvularcula maris TaxID=2965077 RepID=A0A9X2L830_9PROT|nr:GIY-YIG nuclease family protein [Parvularcula maris]MCQ8184838.1 GIY-YIG nuclease family protein [Parvularcula maris]
MRPTVYILASHKNGTLYTGVTSNLAKRVWEHREGAIEGFTERHRVKRLVWYDVHERMESAITLEKRLKRWRRSWKLELIEEQNPEWRDLFFELGPL